MIRIYVKVDRRYLLQLHLTLTSKYRGRLIQEGYYLDYLTEWGVFNLPQYRWAIIGSLIVVSLASTFGQSFTVVMLLIMETFQITHVQAGFMMGLSRLPSIFLPVPAGILIGRIGAKRMGTIALIIGIMACLIVANASSYALLLAGLLMLGTGGVIRTVIDPAIITHWFSSKELGRAMGLLSVAMLFVPLLGPVVSLIAIAYGWRVNFYIGGVSTIAALAVFWFIVREGPLLHASQPREGQSKAVRGALSNAELWKVGIFRLLEIVGTTGFTVWAPTFLVEFMGIGLVYASFVSSLFLIFGYGLAPLAGSISDRSGKRRQFLAVGCGLWALTLFTISLAPTVEIMIPLIILGGMCASPIPVVCNTVISEVAGPTQSGIGFGIQAVCLSIGGAVAPIIIGYVRSATGSLFISFASSACFLAAATIVSITLKTR